MIYFGISEYYATGEGRAIMIMLSKNHKNEDGFVEAFKDKFGHYYSSGLELKDKDIFMKEYDKYLPEHVKKYLEKDDAFAYEYYSSVYINYA